MKKLFFYSMLATQTLYPMDATMRVVQSLVASLNPFFSPLFEDFELASTTSFPSTPIAKTMQEQNDPQDEETQEDRQLTRIKNAIELLELIQGARRLLLEQEEDFQQDALLVQYQQIIEKNELPTPPTTTKTNSSSFLRLASIASFQKPPSLTEATSCDSFIWVHTPRN